MENYFSKLNIHAADEFRQHERHTSELLVPEANFNKDEIGTVKLKHCGYQFNFS
jgi:hypothetical protein